ncbi:hypothetical protein OQA88_1396 [Cercophora sp. LCS_1]
MLGSHSSRRPSEAQTTTPLNATPLVLNRDLWTRNLCIIGLILGWGAAVATTAVGSYIVASGPVEVPHFLLDKAAFIGNVVFTFMNLPEPQPYVADHRVYPVSQSGMVVIPLLLQITLTLVLSTLSSIHSTTLRWSLWREGRLRHNSNLRLFTSTKLVGPNKWPANIISALGLILAYGSTTLITFPVTILGTITVQDEQLSIVPVTPSAHGIDFNAWGLVGLGIGLLLQCTISTWCFTSARHIGTWNSNPLATARACHILSPPSSPSSSRKLASSRSGTGTGTGTWMLQSPTATATTTTTAFHLPFSPTLSTTLPKPIQPALKDVLPLSRKLANHLWAITSLLALWMTIIAAVGAKRGTANWAYVESRSGRVDFLSSWQGFGEVSVLYSDPFTWRREWVGLLIQCALFSVFVVALQLAESVVQLVRDEAIWRRTQTVGAGPDASVLVESMRCWFCWVMFAYKCVVPWLFGHAVSCNTSVFMALFPLVTMTGLFVVLGAFVEWLVRKRERGMLPVAYGHVGIVGGLVDVWEERIFWGDKGEVADGVRVSGTAGKRARATSAALPYFEAFFKHEVKREFVDGAPHHNCPVIDLQEVSQAGRDEPEAIHIDEFHAANNSFGDPDLDFDALSSLFVKTKVNFESMLFHSKPHKYTWKEIVITGNPKLSPKTAV